MAFLDEAFRTLEEALDRGQLEVASPQVESRATGSACRAQFGFAPRRIDCMGNEPTGSFVDGMSLHEPT